MPLHVHHVIWRSKNGLDVPENLITVCEACHAKIHKNAKADQHIKQIAGTQTQKYAPTTILNTIMPYFYEWLSKQFAVVTKTYGYETKEKRFESNLPKSHVIDAYLISNKDMSDAKLFRHIRIYHFQQFRKHNRQLIHAIRDRNYTCKNKIVAKNRHKRMGQTQDSLAEVRATKGMQFLRELRVSPGIKMIRKKFNGFRRGDIVQYEGKYCVVKGFGSLGQTIGFVFQKKYVSAKGVQRILHNTGIVCVSEEPTMLSEKPHTLSEKPHTLSEEPTMLG